MLKNVLDASGDIEMTMNGDALHAQFEPCSNDITDLGQMGTFGFSDDTPRVSTRYHHIETQPPGRRTGSAHTESPTGTFGILSELASSHAESLTLTHPHGRAGVASHQSQAADLHSTAIPAKPIHQ